MCEWGPGGRAATCLDVGRASTVRSTRAPGPTTLARVTAPDRTPSSGRTGPDDRSVPAGEATAFAGSPGGGDGLPRVVLLVGASSGIGRSTALQLARPGAVLALAARGREGLEAVAAECRERGARVSVHPLDIADDGAVAACVAELVRLHGRLDACVHSAAIVAYGDFTEVPTEIFDRVVATNVTGAANVARHALRAFREQGEGTLVVVGSVLGKIVTPWMSSYSTSKFAIHAFVRALQIEQRSFPGVHVNLVSPGSVETPVYRRAATYAGRHGKPPWPVYRPETVASRVVRILAAPGAARRETRVGWANPVMVAGFTYLPGLFDVLVRPMMSVLGLDRRHVGDTTGNVLEPSGTSPTSEGTATGAPARRRTRESR